MIRRGLESLRQHGSRDELVSLLDELLERWDRDREESARRLNRLTDNIQTLDSRLLTVENSRIFRIVQKLGNYFGAWTAKGTRYVQSRQGEAGERRLYQQWLEAQVRRQPNLDEMRAKAAAFHRRPRFSLLLHLESPRWDALQRTVESVLRQGYADWELCVCDDASPDPRTTEYFQSLEARDARVQYVRSERVMGAVSSLCRAGMLGGGDYALPIGQHSALEPHALFRLAEALQKDRFDVLYADEDCLNATGERERPCFKPAWSPDLLVSRMYLGRFFAVSREVMNELEWFLPGSEGAHFYDLALRMSELTVRVGRVPEVLYSDEPTDGHPEAERHVLEAAIRRRGWKAALETHAERQFLIRRKLNGTPLASIIICSRNPKLLRNCLKCIEALTAYPVREIVVMQHKTGDDAAMDKLLAKSNCVRIEHTGPFDFAAMNNRAAEAASGEVLVFLNDDVEPLSADWLKELLAHVQRPEVGVAGAKLLYPTGAIQHAGIALGLMDGAGHPLRGTFGGSFWPWSTSTRNVSAVTGACMAMRRRVFEELGGFDTRFPVNYNDVDLCLRARQAGYEVICEGSAVLRHLESKTRVQGVSWRERELFHELWGSLIEQGDPFYSPHLSRTREDCSLFHP